MLIDHAKFENGVPTNLVSPKFLLHNSIEMAFEVNLPIIIQVEDIFPQIE